MLRCKRNLKPKAANLSVKLAFKRKKDLGRVLKKTNHIPALEVSVQSSFVSDDNVPSVKQIVVSITVKCKTES